MRRAIQPQSVALGLFALLAGLAFVLVIGQVLARRTFLDASDNSTLHALGMTRGQFFAAAMLKVAAISIVGGAVAVVVAALASPLMPIGPARLAEPHRGFAINVAILGVGFAAIVAVLLLVAILPAGGPLTCERSALAPATRGPRDGRVWSRRWRVPGPPHRR